MFSFSFASRLPFGELQAWLLVLWASIVNRCPSGETSEEPWNAFRAGTRICENWKAGKLDQSKGTPFGRAGNARVLPLAGGQNHVKPLIFFDFNDF